MKIRPASGFQYSGKPWYAQVFVGSNWGFTSDASGTYHAMVGNRPPSGDEEWIMAWTPIVLGAKGLIYDREQTTPDGRELDDNYIDDEWVGFGLGHGGEFYENNNITDPSTLLNRNDIGGDYILQYDVSNYEPTRIDKYIDFNNSATFLRLRGPDNIYVGRKSARLQLSKIHKWVNTVGDELMDLRLTAWYGKGYKVLQNCDEEAGYTNNVWDEYIDVDNVHQSLITEPSLTFSYHTGQKELLDSSYFDITLHRHVDDPNLTSNTFYIGCVNRITDPMIEMEDVHNGNETCLVFLSTSELEGFCQNSGTYTIYDQSDGTSRTFTLSQSEWQDKWWKRYGCRELKIPFQYEYDSDNPEEYALLHISELGCSSTFLNSQTWRDEKYYHMVDTVIGQDRTLSVRLLPGEGKILKVEVLAPPDKIEGILTYSNQRKMVAYPICDANGNPDEDSIYYHLVYHRPDAGDDDRMKVYYRRSYPVHPISNQSNIEWQAEKCISDEIYCGCNVQDNPEETHCAHPSIVVRKDGNVPKVYVIYGCKGGETCSSGTVTYPEVAIVETIFEAQANYSDPSYTVTPHVIDFAAGYDYHQWGTPMVNASNTINYYTWADSLLGIASAFKEPDEYCLSNPFYSHFAASPEGLFCKHPSLNSYSRIDSDPEEDAAALVWQEQSNTYGAEPKIYYAQLTNDGSDISLATLSNVSPSYTTLNGANNIIELSSPNMHTFHQFPTVYRGIESGIDPPIAKDRIAWQTHNPNISLPNCPGYEYPGIIQYRAINQRENSGQTEIELLPVTSIRGETGGDALFSPNLSQGRYWGSVDNESDSAMILEFHECDLCDPSDDDDKMIWNYPHGYTSVLTSSTMTIDNVDDWSQAALVQGKGSISHLAARKKIFKELDDDYWWQNRRVFRFVESSTEKIATHGEHFYKGGADKRGALPFLGFVRESRQSFISPILINSEPVMFDMETIHGKCDSCKDRLDGFLPSILPTKWFTVGADTRLGFMTAGLDTNEVEMYIERRTGRNLFRVNVSEYSARQINKVNYRLINGQDYEYRLLLVKTQPEAYYVEDIVLFDDLENDGYGKQSPLSGIIDLGGSSYEGAVRDGIMMSIFPNPADETVYVTPWLPEEAYLSSSTRGDKQTVMLTVFNSLGTELYKKEAVPGVTTAIQTDNLPQGIYYIRAEQRIAGWQTQFVAPLVKSFVVER